jgi:ribosomal protein S18 acetylase RimI-like enzyme
MLDDAPTSFNVDVNSVRAQSTEWWDVWAHEAAEAAAKVVFFAEVSEAAVGMAAAHTEGDVVHAGALWVGPMWRGNGIANALLDGVETWAHDVRARYIELSVASWNTGARGLYERRYYRDTGRRLATRFEHRELVLGKPVGF